MMKPYLFVSAHHGGATTVCGDAVAALAMLRPDARIVVVDFAGGTLSRWLARGQAGNRLYDLLRGYEIQPLKLGNSNFSVNDNIELIDCNVELDVLLKMIPTHCDSTNLKNSLKNFMQRNLNNYDYIIMDVDFRLLKYDGTVSYAINSAIGDEPAIVAVLTIHPDIVTVQNFIDFYSKRISKVVLNRVSNKYFGKIYMSNALPPVTRFLKAVLSEEEALSEEMRFLTIADIGNNATIGPLLGIPNIAIAKEKTTQTFYISQIGCYFGGLTGMRKYREDILKLAKELAGESEKNSGIIK